MNGVHSGIIYSLVRIPNSNLVASGASDKLIKLWNLTSMKEDGVLTGHT